MTVATFCITHRNDLPLGPMEFSFAAQLSALYKHFHLQVPFTQHWQSQAFLRARRASDHRASGPKPLSGSGNVPYRCTTGLDHPLADLPVSWSSWSVSLCRFQIAPAPTTSAVSPAVLPDLTPTTCWTITLPDTVRPLPSAHSRCM